MPFPLCLEGTAIIIALQGTTSQTQYIMLCAFLIGKAGTQSGHSYDALTALLDGVYLLYMPKFVSVAGKTKVAKLLTIVEGLSQYSISMYS